MILYNDDNIIVGQIKQLLHSFNLPQCKVFDKNVEYKEGDYYIKDGYLWGVFASDDPEYLEHRRIRQYKFGDKIENLTKTLDLRNNIYDNYTHEYLGNYLRFVRDFYGIDLMSLYNCNGYQTPVSLDIDVKRIYPYAEDEIYSDSHLWELNSDTTVEDNTINFTQSTDIAVNGGNARVDITPGEHPGLVVTIEFNSNSADYSILMVPVRFGKPYTVAIDCNTKIEMFCGFYDTAYLTSPLYEEGELESATYYKTSSSRFNHPFVYNKLTQKDLPLDYQQEGNLKLFIKIPKGCESSVVVLEGDFLKNTESYITQNARVLGNRPLQYEAIDYTVEGAPVYGVITEYNYATKSQLLKVNSKRKFLLADKLVGYLTDAFITPIDPVPNNIKRLQKELKVVLGYNNTYRYFGIWDNRMREALYKYCYDTGLINTASDLLYYLDKDIESRMGGLPYDLGVIDWQMREGKKEQTKEPIFNGVYKPKKEE